MKYKLPPAFCQVFFLETSSKHMSLPRTEVIYPENVMVRGRHGNDWQLKLEKYNKCYFFTEGWIKFAADNYLHDGDILVFNYVSEGLFEVMIFDHSGSEKNLSLSLDLNAGNNYLGRAPDLNDFKSNQGIKPDRNTHENNQGMDLDFNICEHNQGLALNLNNWENNQGGALDVNLCQNNVGVATLDHHAFPNNEGQSTVELEQIDDHCKANERNNSEIERGDMEYDEENKIVDQADKEYVPDEDHFEPHEVEDKEEEQSEAPDATRKRIRRKRLPDLYGLDIFTSGLADPPLNPYFVTSNGVIKKHELYIPMDIVKRIQVELPSMIRLVDPKGRKFVLRRSTRKNGRIFYTGGWRKFCKDNNVDEKDLCIIEFVKPKVEPQIKVTIVRASSSI